jgi:hypothetical protein
VIYITEMISCGIIFLPSFLKVGTGVEGILRLLSQQFERL